MKVSDAAERLRAIAPDNSCIVQAPAGSGKTGLLIQRYLRLLALVDHPEEIVAITFTRKAATEMQDRIVNALERARRQAPPEDDNARLTDELARAVLARDEGRDWQLEYNPGRLRIQTIDSLCAGLTRQMPVLAKVGTQPAIVESPEELYREAAANTLAELENGESWSEDIAVLLAHLDNNLPLARNMLAGMLARRDQWLRHVTRENERVELEAALKHIVASTLALVRRSFPPQHVHEFLECLRYASANLAREESDSLLVLCQGIDDLPGSTAMELPRWRAIADICLTKDNQWRKQANASIGFPAPSGTTAEKAGSRNMKDRFQNLLAQLSGDDKLQTLLVDIRYLPPLTYTDNEWRVVQALCKLLVLADAQLRVIFGARNQMDFTGISRAAIEALESEGAPTDLALHLDYQIRHLLIDEYQDVSINQYNLLQQLTAGWVPGDGHTLFLVGDPMQSIYRFREADVGLFINTWQEKRLGQVPLVPLNISVNFRSQAGIVDWINQAFSRVLPQIADSARGAVSFVPAEAWHPAATTDAVMIHPLLNRDDTAEAELILQLVRAAQDRYQDGKVAVLVRNRTHLAEIIPVLREAGLRFRAIEIEGLGQRPAIRDLMALTLALHHFADRINWLACLRAPWCGLGLDDLLVLAGTDKTRTIWECMQDEATVKKLGPDGRRRLENFRNVLSSYFSGERRRSLRRALESVWMTLGGPATLESETDLEDAGTFFALLEQYDRGGALAHREQFLESVARLYAAPAVQDERLQIMTIHKAKGLEFDTVIVPGLGRGSAKDEKKLLLWTEHPHGMYQDLLLAPIKGSARDKSSIYDFVERLEKEKQQYELGRLLYVASTRAKRQLHLVATLGVNSHGEPGKPRNDSLLMQIWPVLEPQFQEALEKYQPRETRSENVITEKTGGLRRLAADWSLPAAPEPVRWSATTQEEPAPAALPEFEWAGATIRHVGTVVHRYIQKIAEEDLEHWDVSRINTMQSGFASALKRLGVRAGELGWAGQRVTDALSNMISDKRGRWLLANKHGDIHSEYALTGVYQGRIINIKIDRTFIDEDGMRWVVDYKTGRHEGMDRETFLDQELGRYQAQLEKYGTLLQNYDGRPIRMGLYFPLLKGWRELNF